MDLVFLVFTLITMVWLGFRSPTFFVIAYLIVSTDFLGFAEFSVIVGGSLDIGFPTINALLLFFAARASTQGKVPKHLFGFTLVLVLLTLWGLIYPVVIGSQKFLQSVISGKNFLCFALLWHLVAHSSSLDPLKLGRAIYLLSIYLSLVYIFHLFTGLAPPAYFVNSGFNAAMSAPLELSAWSDKIRVSYPTYISLGLVCAYAFWSRKLMRTEAYFASAAVFMIGLTLSGFLSLTATSIVTFIAVTVLDPRFGKLRLSVILTRGVLFFAAIIIVFSASQSLRTFSYDKLTGIVSGSDSALVSRSHYNEFRWRAIEDNPIMGYGFLHKSAPLTRELGATGSHRFVESLGVVDSGYVDLLVKFGYLGTSIFLLSYLVMIFRFRPLRYGRGGTSFAMGLFLVQYLIVAFTWSVFSFTHGIIPMCLAIFLATFWRSQLPNDNPQVPKNLAAPKLTPHLRLQ